MTEKEAELRCVIHDLTDQAKDIRHQRERLIAYLRSASNYVDVLGGDSRVYRGVIAEIEEEQL